LSIETISATNALVQYFAKDVGLKSPVVIVSPNTEFVKKAQKFQKKLKTESGLDVDYAAFMYDPPDEMKSVTNYADYSELLGNVKDADVVIVEDLVNTAAELSILCKRLMKEGARRVFVSGNHGLFTGNSMELIDLSPIEKVVVTDTIPLAHNQSKKVVQVPIADLIARVIHAETKGFQSPTADDDDEDEYEIEAQ
jgi:ribose-phosphate pyrophosphokinase